MAPSFLIVVLICVCITAIELIKSDPEDYAKKKFLRSPKNPVASNAELFDAFGYKPDLEKEIKDSESDHQQ